MYKKDWIKIFIGFFIVRIENSTWDLQQLIYIIQLIELNLVGQNIYWLYGFLMLFICDNV